MSIVLIGPSAGRCPLLLMQRHQVFSYETSLPSARTCVSTAQDSSEGTVGSKQLSSGLSRRDVASAKVCLKRSALEVWNL